MREGNQLRLFWAGILLLAPNVAAQGVVFQTSVVPKPEEDIAADCRYEITIPNPLRPIRAVWVIFDRGRDMLRYYGDPEVQAFAYRNDLALLFPFHCRAKTYEDMDVDPSRGIGRALFAALSQLAQSSGHQELASAKLILLGFSGAGSLVARLAGYAPDRVIAAIPADASQFSPLGIDTVTLSPEAQAVPQLILTGGADHVSGTERPYEYFRKYVEKGAPWAFVVQNKTPHCCIINAKKLILLWLQAMLEERQRSNGAVRRVDSNTGWNAFIATRQTETKDDWGGKTSEVSHAKIQRSRSNPPSGMIPAGWLPNHQVAKEWLSFVKRPEHPATSLP
jgi:dienelactone hydrolase